LAAFSRRISQKRGLIGRRCWIRMPFAPGPAGTGMPSCPYPGVRCNRTRLGFEVGLPVRDTAGEAPHRTRSFVRLQRRFASPYVRPSERWSLGLPQDDGYRSPDCPGLPSRSCCRIASSCVGFFEGKSSRPRAGGDNGPA
jgi:hypothetical protein